MTGLTPAQLTAEVGGRCLVMGVVNVTPDSFSDGGRWFDRESAIKHGLDLVAQGADILDVGGESTRPGAPRVDEAEELDRVVPVVRALAAEGHRVSVDTMRASVAVACLKAGAVMLNDVSGGLADSSMATIAAHARATYIAMHWRGHSEHMDSLNQYPNGVAAAVTDELRDRVDLLLAAGLDRDLIVLDPGLGFSKDADQNWEMLRDLDGLTALGYPLLIGTSRKRFLGALLPGPDGAPVPPVQRDDATAATSAISAFLGAWCVRVHDVPATVAAVRVAQAWQAGRAGA